MLLDVVSMTLRMEGFLLGLLGLYPACEAMRTPFSSQQALPREPPSRAFGNYLCRHPEQGLCSMELEDCKCLAGRLARWSLWMPCGAVPLVHPKRWRLLSVPTQNALPKVRSLPILWTRGLLRLRRSESNHLSRFFLNTHFLKIKPKQTGAKTETRGRGDSLPANNKKHLW